MISSPTQNFDPIQIPYIPLESEANLTEDQKTRKNITSNVSAIYSKVLNSIRSKLETKKTLRKTASDQDIEIHFLGGVEILCADPQDRQKKLNGEYFFERIPIILNGARRFFYKDSLAPYVKEWENQISIENSETFQDFMNEKLLYEYPKKLKPYLKEWNKLSATTREIKFEGDFDLFLFSKFDRFTCLESDKDPREFFYFLDKYERQLVKGKIKNISFRDFVLKNWENTPSDTEENHRELERFLDIAKVCNLHITFLLQTRYFSPYELEQTKIHFENGCLKQIGLDSDSGDLKPLMDKRHDKTLKYAFVLGDIPDSEAKCTHLNSDGIQTALFAAPKQKYTKKEGKFAGQINHSSFFHGGPVRSAGMLLCNAEGKIVKISDNSGHYHPKEKEMQEVIHFLKENDADLTLMERVFYKQR